MQTLIYVIRNTKNKTLEGVCYESTKKDKLIFYNNNYIYGKCSLCKYKNRE